MGRGPPALPRPFLLAAAGVARTWPVGPRLVASLGEQQTPARDAPRKNETNGACPEPRDAEARGRRVLHVCKTTLGNGYLGSRIDEERSEMRYLV